MKRFMSIIVLGSAGAVIAGCATVAGSGTYGKLVSTPVKAETFSQDLRNSDKTATDHGVLVSASENKDLSSEYFTLVDLTFENKSPEWVRIKKIDINFGNEKANADIRFPVGQDLVDWAQSAQQVKAIHDYNVAMAFTAVGVTGAVMSRHSAASTSGAGMAMAAGAGMVLSAQTISNKLDDLQRAKVVPEDHLLSGSVAIPPGLHKKKFITLYAKKPKEIPYVEKMAVTMTYDDGKTESVIIRFRQVNYAGMSAWQRGHLEAKAAGDKAVSYQRPM